MGTENKIIEEIQNTLNTAILDLIKKGDDKNPDWTKRIKTDLVELGKKLRYSPCAHSVDTAADWGEWLYMENSIKKRCDERKGHNPRQIISIRVY